MAVCAAVFAIGIIQTAVAFTQSNKSSATGFGEVRSSFPDSRYSVAFSAIRHPDNTVTGQAEYHSEDGNTGEKVRLHLEVNCLKIEGNMALISGIIKNANDPNANGATGFFRVLDGGEGNNNLEDGITPVFPVATDLERNCENINTGITPLPITAGNIQVRP